jgi:hypothetical protein
MYKIELPLTCVYCGIDMDEVGTIDTEHQFFCRQCGNSAWADEDIECEAHQDTNYKQWCVGDHTGCIWNNGHNTCTRDWEVL